MIPHYEPRHDKTNKMTVRPAKTQISLGIRPVWSKSSLCAQWVPKDPSFLSLESEDSDQTGWMPRLIWVFAERTFILLVLSCRGSYVLLNYIFGRAGWQSRTRRLSQCRHYLLIIFMIVRGLFGKFVEFGHKIFKYQYNSFILWNLTGGHLWISIP